MKKRIKKNKRTKALFGIDDAALGIILAGISAAGAIGGSAISASNQRAIADANERRATFAGNADNYGIFSSNLGQAANYNQNEEIGTLKTNNLSTINSNFKCGGKRRMKKAGGTISANVKGLDRYI